MTMLPTPVILAVVSVGADAAAAVDATITAAIATNEAVFNACRTAINSVSFPFRTGSTREELR